MSSYYLFKTYKTNHLTSYNQKFLIYLKHNDDLYVYAIAFDLTDDNDWEFNYHTVCDLKCIADMEVYFSRYCSEIIDDDKELEKFDFLKL
jgi:hypothetical protein